jgi:type IV pilus assembly protein PilC
MLFSPRISNKDLIGLCQRTSTALEAGVDARTVWAGEAKRAKGFAARSRFREISDAINSGCGMREALQPVADYFPPLFVELIHVGDQTGHLDEALRELANHYDYQRKLAQGFMLAMIWPLIELGLSIIVIGFLIWIMGVIGKSSGTEPIDILGFGLTGNSGLALYATFWVAVGIACYLIFTAMRRGMGWVRPLQHLAIKIPVIGSALESLALARLAWSLRLTLNSGMDTRRAVGLAVRTSRNAKFTDGARSIDEVLAEGQSLSSAFVQTGAYPHEFLDVLHVGEQSGTIVESMERLSRQYRTKAETAMKILGVFAFFASFGLIAAFIIFMIFRIASFYIGTINDALQM